MARKVVALKDALVGKSTEFWDKAEFQAQAAEDFMAASAKAQSESQTAAKHAAAVAEAVRILEEAGVTV